MVRIRMRQGAGEAAVPVVRVRAEIKKGQVADASKDSKLGAHVHASIARARVRMVTPEYVEIVA